MNNNDTGRQIRAMVMDKKTYLFCQTCEDKVNQGVNDVDLYKLLSGFWENIN